MSDLDAIFEKYPFVQRDSLIPILQEIQDKYGYLSEEAIVKVGTYMNLPTAKIYGLASFYNYFRFIKKGKYHIKICNGTSCHINANILILDKIEKMLGIRNGEVTKDGIFSLEEATCMASCGQGPVVAVNERYYTHVGIEDIEEIIVLCKNMEI